MTSFKKMHLFSALLNMWLFHGGGLYHVFCMRTSVSSYKCFRRGKFFDRGSFPWGTFLSGKIDKIYWKNITFPLRKKIEKRVGGKQYRGFHKIKKNPLLTMNIALLWAYLHWRVKFGQAKFMRLVYWLVFRFDIFEINSRVKYLAHLILLKSLERANPWKELDHWKDKICALAIRILHHHIKWIYIV